MFLLTLRFILNRLNIFGKRLVGMIEFYDMTVDNWNVVSSFLSKGRVVFGEFTGAYCWPWAIKYPVKYAIAYDCVVINENKVYSLPIGRGDKLKACQEVREYCNKRGKALIWGPLTEDQLGWLKENNPSKNYVHCLDDEYQDDIFVQRDIFEDMNGNKLSSIRRMIRKFNNLGEWTYDDFNVSDALAILDRWTEEKKNRSSKKGEEWDERPCREYILNGGDYLSGGILHLNGKPVGFNLGERISEDTCVCVYQKALREYPGVYQVLYQEFARHADKNIKYINITSSAGVPSLLFAKMLYHPFHIEQKHVVLETFR